MARPFATPEQRDEVRRKIRHAAAGIFRREGLAGITARRIAQEAGVSVGAIYAHFGDLPSLMQSFWSGPVARQNEAFRDLAARHADPAVRLRTLLSAYLEFGRDDPALYRNAFLFVRPESHDRPAQVSFAAFDFPRLLVEALQEGQAAGLVVAGDPVQLAQILWSGVHGCLALPTNIDRVAFAPAAEIAGPMLEALLRSVLQPTVLSV